MRTYVRNALVLLIIGMCLWGFVQGLIWMERLSNGQPKNYNKRELYESYYEDDTDCSQVDTMKTEENGEEYPDYNRDEVKAVTYY